MTLSSTTTRIEYNGDDSTVEFDVPFKFLLNSHITVIHTDSAGTDTTWTEGTQYTLAGAGDDEGGTLTVETSPTDYTPASGETLTIKRVPPETQLTDLVAGGALPSVSIEDALDLLTMLIQTHSEEIARAVLFAAASTTTGITFPEPEADSYLGWNSAGDDLENKSVSTGTGDISFGENLGSGIGVFEAKNDDTLQFNTLAAGDGIAIGEDTLNGEIDIAVDLGDDTPGLEFGGTGLQVLLSAGVSGITSDADGLVIDFTDLQDTIGALDTANDLISYWDTDQNAQVRIVPDDFISEAGILADLVDDVTPQLGGDLDVNGQSIVSVSDGDIPIVPDGTGQILLGETSLQDNPLIRPNVTDYSVENASPSSASNTLTLDYTTGPDFSVTLDEDVTTITISNWPGSGTLGKITLELTQDGSGSHSVTFPAGWIWPSGSVSTMPTDAGDDLELVIWSRDGGSTVKAAEIGQEFT